MKFPLVAIVIVNSDGLADTMACLDSLSNQTYENIRVIVIDNGSRLNELSMIRKHRIRPICTQNDSNLGFAKASNLGIRAALKAGADFVLLLNNDTVVSADFLVNLIQVASKYPRAGVIGPKILYYGDSRYINSAGGLIYWPIGYVKDLGLNMKDYSTTDIIATRDWISGCAMLVRRSVFESISLLDEDTFPQGGEDYDFSVRAREAGFQVIYCPRSVILHKVSKTRRAMGARQITILTAGATDPKIALLKKHGRTPKRHGGMAIACYRTVFRQLEALNYVVFAKDPRLRSYYQQRVVGTFLRSIRGLLI
jgi:GT2 family glycosyltransferase